MSTEDENAFFEYVRSLGNLLILPGTSLSSDFAPVDSFPEPSQDELTRWFWLQYTGRGLPLATEHVTEKGLHVLGWFQSPVVEVRRSWVVSQVVLPAGIQDE